MCRVHLKAFSSSEAMATEEEPAQGDIFFWWNTAPKQDAQNYCLSTWCHEHEEELRTALATLMFSLGTVSIDGQEIQQWLRPEQGLSQWYTSLPFEKHPHMLPGLFGACKLYALEQLLKKHVPHCQHFFVHVAEDRVQQSLQAFCAQQGIPYTCTAAKTTLWQRFLDKSIGMAHLYTCLPHILQSFLRLGHWLYAMRRLLCQPVHFAKHTAAQHATLVSYFPHVHAKHAEQGLFRSHYWENLHDLLLPLQQKNALHIHHLFIRINSTQYTLPESIALKEKFQKKAEQEQRSESFYYVEEFLRPKDIFQAIKCFWHGKKQAAHITPPLQPHWHWSQSSIPLWPWFQDAWQQSFGGWRALERCLQRQAFLAYATALQKHLDHNTKHSSHNHIWSLFPWENCPWERLFTHAMRGAFPQSAVYAIQHSCIRTTDFRYVDGQDFFAHAAQNRILEQSLPHLYCLNGSHALHSLQGHIPHEKLYMVEALRYAYLDSLSFSLGQIPLKHARPAHLLLMGSYFPQEVNAQIRLLAQWWKHGKNAQKYHKKVHIKAHPHLCMRSFFQKHALEVEDFHFFTSDMQDMWQHVALWHKKEEACLMWLCNSTTVSLEAAHMGMALCVQKAENDFNLCPLGNSSHVAYVGQVAELTALLNKAPQPFSHAKYFSLNARLSLWKSLLGIA